MVDQISFAKIEIRAPSHLVFSENTFSTSPKAQESNSCRWITPVVWVGAGNFDWDRRPTQNATARCT